MDGNRRQRGFSLLEVMMAMVVLTVGLMAVVGLFGSGFQALQMGNTRTVAAQMARNKMEELRLLNPALILADADSSQGFARNWASAPSEKDPALWVVTVRVQWKNSQNNGQSISLKSFVFF